MTTMSDDPSIRLLIWCSLVSVLQELNWVAERARSEKLTGARDLLMRWCEKGPDDPTFVEFCAGVLDLCEDAMSGKPHLELIQGGDEPRAT